MRGNTPPPGGSGATITLSRLGVNPTIDSGRPARTLVHHRRHPKTSSLLACCHPAAFAARRTRSAPRARVPMRVGCGARFERCALLVARTSRPAEHSTAPGVPWVSPRRRNSITRVCPRRSPAAALVWPPGKIGRSLRAPGRVPTIAGRCGCSSMVELQLPKLLTWVRFPSPAPTFSRCSTASYRSPRRVGKTVSGSSWRRARTILAARRLARIAEHIM